VHYVALDTSGCELYTEIVEIVITEEYDYMNILPYMNSLQLRGVV